MSIRKRDVHFSDWTKVRHALVCNNVQGITETSSFDDVRAFLINSESGSNPFYYYVCYIKETKEIYTHGQFYKCGDSLYDDTELRDLIGTKADLSALEALVSEVAENELVTAKALYDLNDRKLDKSELDNIDLSNYVDLETYNSDLDSINASITNKANQSDLEALSAEVEENEEVTAAALTDLHENKADKSEIPDVSTLATNTDLNTKQDLLVSGTNIKTVNGDSILGSGDIEIHDTKVTSAENHYGYNSDNATSTTGAFVTKITKDAANHVTSFESRALTSTDIPGLDASKITTGEISIDRLPKGALERLFVVESEAAAISATVQEGDVVQVTGNSNKMYFCISNTATTFATKFKEFTAGTATSVPWSGITGKPTGIDGWGDRIGVIESGYATESFVTSQGYITASALAPYALRSEIPSLTGYATQSWVLSQQYLTSISGSMVTDALGVTLGYARGRNSIPLIELSGVMEIGKYIDFHTLDEGDGVDYSLRIECQGAFRNRVYFPTTTGTLALTSDLPTKLSQLTDDVVAGKYLSLSGGTLSGSNRDLLNLDTLNTSGPRITLNENGNLIALIGCVPKQTTTDYGAYFVNVSSKFGVILGNDKKAYITLNTDTLSKDYQILHSGNYSDYALSKYGGTVNGSITATSFIGNLTGNADSATKLATPRTIWGQSFDGTGNINGAIDVSLVASDLDIPVIKFASDCYFDKYGNYVFGKSAGSFSVFNGSHLNAIFHVLKTGNVAIGAKTADEKLHVYGNVKASGSMYAVDFATTSDNRLKDFVSDIYVDFESIKQIPKKYYYWKDKSMGEDLQLGTSAQELAKIYPECVHYDETNDRYSVNYQKLSIVALAAIDKLHDRVSELESKLYDKNN